MYRNMPMDTVVELLTLFESHGIFVWVDGGWAVDALLGEQTRPHNDLDLVVKEHDLSTLQQILEERNYKVVGTNDKSPWNFVLGDEQGHEVDLHLIVLNAAGHGIYGPPDNGIFYPVDSLTGRGEIGGYPVRCISPDWLMRFHTGYEFDEQDVRDVLALHKRYGIPVPPEYMSHAKPDTGC